MESPSSLSAFRHRLRATVCCCFGQGGGGGLGERMRWRRRRAGVEEFRYDQLSYALNFDEGEGEEEERGARVRGVGDGLLYHSLVAAADAGRGRRGRVAV